jgi:hypothetical protein
MHEAVMKHLPQLPSRQLAVLAGAFALMLAAIPVAHAFTLEDAPNTKSDGTARYADPDKRFTGSSFKNGQTTIREGNTTVQFGRSQSFDQRYDANRYFDPFAGSSSGR